jgi:hypothetical protein
MPDLPHSDSRTLKGFGARLVRNVTESANGAKDPDDWHNYLVVEGTSGWARGLSFERGYAYQPRSETSEAHHLYRLLVTRQRGLDVLCVVYGRTSKKAWTNAFTALYQKGVMPADAYTVSMQSDAAAPSGP